MAAQGALSSVRRLADAITRGIIRDDKNLGEGDVTLADLARRVEGDGGGECEPQAPDAQREGAERSAGTRAGAKSEREGPAKDGECEAPAKAR